MRTLLLAALLARLVELRRGLARGAAPLASASPACRRRRACARRLSAERPARPAARARQLEPAACQPWCASLPRMRLEVDATALRARSVEVDVAAETKVPLPGQAQGCRAR
ncbi:MAG: hypothetical protein U0802_02000 [Candidatus Binatia bacterium]